MVSVLASGTLSFVLTAALVPLIRVVARRMGWLLARPASDRWHRRPVYKVGGLAMCAALVPLLWSASGDSELTCVLLLASLMFGVGLVDDCRPLHPVIKFGAQLGAASAFLAAGPIPSIAGIPWIDAGLSLCWIVLITNAFNLLDNIDGLSAGIATIASGCALASTLGSSAGAGGLVVGLAALAGAATAFLIYNWQPASAFMGDSGSHLLGSFIAGATLLSASQASEPLRQWPVLVLLLAVPIADTSLVIVTRLRAGVSPFIGGRDHISHRLVALGWSERSSVATLYGFAMAGGLVACAVAWLPPAVASPAAIVFAVVAIVATCYVIRMSSHAEVEVPA